MSDPSRNPSLLQPILDEGEVALPRLHAIGGELREQPAGLQEVRPRDEPDQGPHAAPVPLERVVTQAGADGVEVVVACALEEMRLAFDPLRVESSLEEVAAEA